VSAENILFPIRWTRSFLRADAEQPTGTFRGLLAELRRNQWVLLNWRSRVENRFYPFKKSELVPRLEGQPSGIPVGTALRLEKKPASGRNLKTRDASPNVSRPDVRFLRGSNLFARARVQLGSVILRASGLSVASLGPKLSCGGVKMFRERYVVPGQYHQLFGRAEYGLR
jgi:hypothetical protein